MSVWRGGAKKKAPYESTHVRVPVPIKSKVQALINEFRESIDGFKKSETKQSESSLTSSEDEEDREDEEEEYGTEPSELETIKSQAATIQSCLSEIRFLEYKLEQLSLLTSLDDAKEEAKKRIRSKERKTLMVATLLSKIYQSEVTEEEMM